MFLWACALHRLQAIELQPQATTLVKLYTVGDGHGGGAPCDALFLHEAWKLRIDAQGSPSVHASRFSTTANPITTAKARVAPV